MRCVGNPGVANWRLDQRQLATPGQQVVPHAHKQVSGTWGSYRTDLLAAV